MFEAIIKVYNALIVTHTVSDMENQMKNHQHKMRKKKNRTKSRTICYLRTNFYSLAVEVLFVLHQLGICNSTVNKNKNNKKIIIRYYEYDGKPTE